MRRTNFTLRVTWRRGLAAAAILLLVIGCVDVGLAYYGEASASESGPEIVWPAAPETPRVRFVRSITSPEDLKLKKSSVLKKLFRKVVGLEDGSTSLVAPYGITTDSRGRIVVADPKGAAIHVFDVAGKKYKKIGAPKGQQFVSIVAVAVDGDDNIYVADTVTGKLFVFDRDGKFKNLIGGEEGGFNRPSGLAIDKEARRLYVVETVAGRVEVLNLAGRRIFGFGRKGVGDGEFNRPTQICVSGGRIYVTDALNARIQVFDADGAFVTKLGRRGQGPGFLDKPKGVATDSEGHVYVVEGLHDVVQIFDQNGAFLMDFGGTGSGRGQLYLPTAIHIDASDNIYVADPVNGRVEVFRYLKAAAASGSPTTTQE
jgi:DNA-binding beta-propeller fold protein YncE